MKMASTFGYPSVLGLLAGVFLLIAPAIVVAALGPLNSFGPVKGQVFEGVFGPRPFDRPCDSEEGHALDFWIGEWDLAWPGGQGGTPEGTEGRGTNKITRVLDDCVIEEQFRTDGFSGMSVSVYNGRTGDWRQTWVDNQSGYISLSGGLRDSVMELRTEPFTNPQGQQQINRMIWTNVTTDSLEWHWQASMDGGKTWQNRWVITYTRRGTGDDR
jgi:hypothetical protein